MNSTRKTLADARRWRLARVLAVVITLALGTLGGPGSTVLASGSALADARPAFGDVSVFAIAPAPGHPFGIAVDGDRIYVSTSAGDFFADPANGGHRNSDGERVFAYDEDGNLVSTTVIPTMPNATMGLSASPSTATAGRVTRYTSRT